MTPERRISNIGHTVSAFVADSAAHPLSQAALISFCIIWWTVGLPTDVLTATLSILAITLTQMVLNRQKLREADDHHRDVAMHAKLDELLRAESDASAELAGIEELEAKEITALKLRLASPGLRPVREIGRSIASSRSRIGDRIQPDYAAAWNEEDES